MLKEINKSTIFLKKRLSIKPEIGIILGTGLGKLVDEIEIKHAIPYEDIPNFPVSTVEGHSGRLICGILSGKKVIAMIWISSFTW